MQALLDAVRATGAKNVVIAGGLDWSYDLSGILQGRQLSDPDGNGVIYANHAYPFKGDSVDVWISRMEKAAASLPIIVGRVSAARAGRIGEYAGAERRQNPPRHWVTIGCSTSCRLSRITSGHGRRGTFIPRPGQP